MNINDRAEVRRATLEQALAPFPGVRSSRPAQANAAGLCGRPTPIHAMSAARSESWTRPIAASTGAEPSSRRTRCGGYEPRPFDSLSTAKVKTGPSSL